MTKENFEESKELVKQARYILGDIEYCQKLQMKISSFRETKDGVDFIGDKQCLYLFKIVLGEEHENRPSLTQDKEKLLDACIEVLTARITRLEQKFANLPILVKETSSEEAVDDEL